MSTPSLTIEVVEETRDNGNRQLVAMYDQFTVARAIEYSTAEGMPAFWVIGLSIEACELIGYCDPFVVEAAAAARSALNTIAHLYSRAAAA